MGEQEKSKAIASAAYRARKAGGKIDFPAKRFCCWITEYSLQQTLIQNIVHVVGLIVVVSTESTSYNRPCINFLSLLKFSGHGKILYIGSHRVQL